ncbi:MAG: DUF4349 domain-containing protein [Acidimicrobiia bacterium]
MRRPRLFHLLISVLILALVISACSAGGGEAQETFSEIGSGLDDSGALAGFGDESTDTTAGASAEEGGEAEASADEDRERLGSGGITPVALQTTEIGRDIIFTGDLTVAVTDVAAAGQEATRIIEGMGGFLFGQQTTGSPEPTSILTFKVNPQDFQSALSALGSIGELRTQNVSASDVTERIVDLESRINTAVASVQRLRTLLEQATDIDAIVDLENELMERETQLETLRGQLRTLQDQVALATIVLTLHETATRPVLTVGVTGYPGHDDGLSCPGSGELTVEQEAEVTVCYEIVNSGDTSLTEFEVRDPVLDIDNEDLISVFGDTNATLEPGESIVLAVEVVAERNLRTQTQVTATAVDEEGDPLSDRPAAATVTMFIQAVDPGGIPTFGEGLEASWELLVRLGQIAVLVLGALIPFFWIPLVLWLVWRMRRQPAGADAASEVSD